MAGSASGVLLWDLSSVVLPVSVLVGVPLSVVCMIFWQRVPKVIAVLHIVLTCLGLLAIPMGWALLDG
jgi:hypothetical protein